MSKIQELNSLIEKEGQMEPHLEQALKHLSSAMNAIQHSMKSNPDNVVSQSEIKLMNRIKDEISKLDKMVKSGE